MTYALTNTKLNQENPCESRERGAIIVEATISLSTFMFAMFMLLNVIQMAYVQERMSVGLDRTAKEMAEFGHVWHATGLASTFTGENGKSSTYANEAADMLKKIGNAVGSDMVTNAGNALEGDSITAILQYGIGTSIAELRFHCNVVPDRRGKAGDYKGFLARNNVENCTLERSKFSNEDVMLRVDYDIKVIQLLKLDLRFHVIHRSYARIWAGEKQ